MKITVIIAIILAIIISLLFNIKIDDSINVNHHKQVKFMSIKTVPANARTGPNKKYRIKLVYVKVNEPVKIIDKFEQWYLVEDIEKNQGWLHARLLSKMQYAVIKSKNKVTLRNRRNDDSNPVAMLENNVRVKVKKCQKNWCLITKDHIEGWVNSEYLWGI